MNLPTTKNPNFVTSLTVGVATVLTAAGAGWLVFAALGFVVLKATAWMDGDLTMWSLERMSLFQVGNMPIPSYFSAGLMFLLSIIMMLAAVGMWGIIFASIGDCLLSWVKPRNRNAF